MELRYILSAVLLVVFFFSAPIAAVLYAIGNVFWVVPASVWFNSIVVSYFLGAE